MTMRAIWPFRHIGLKLVSVAIAVLLWMVIAGEETVERGLRVPLELQQFPPGLELLGDVPTTADVRVRGVSGTLSRISPGDIVAVLDLRGARAGERLFHLTPEQVRAPFGVEVVQVTPPTVAVAFEKAASRIVPIKPATEGRPAAGYMVGKTTADPPTVEVEGPESAVHRVTDALTEPVSVAGAVRTVQETVTVGTLDPAVRVKTQRTVQVTVQIVPAPLEQTVRDRPVHVRKLGANLMATVVPTEVDVTLRGSREALARIRPDETTAYVDLTDMVAGAVRPVQETVTVGTLDPAVRVKTQRTVQVTVQILPAPLEQTVRDRPVLLRNLAANLTATPIPFEVDVTLRGSREALARIQPDDATAYVDLTDMGAGEYTVTVHAESSRDAGVARIEPAAIAVRITSAKN